MARGLHYPGTRAVTVAQVGELEPMLVFTKSLLERLNRRIRAWLASCDPPHLWAPKTIFLLIRVLSVDVIGSRAVALVERAGRGIASKALISHYWGASYRATLAEATLGLLKAGIALDTPPKTCLDAMQIARTLAIRYLRIDPLCIIQDDLDD